MLLHAAKASAVIAVEATQWRKELKLHKAAGQIQKHYRQMRASSALRRLCKENAYVSDHLIHMAVFVQRPNRCRFEGAAPCTRHNASGLRSMPEGDRSFISITPR
eukprot:SAG31_NODE_1042_length_10187_cov_54.452121_11_plen_105_part_00